MAREETFTVEAVGVGRKDYSSGIENSVEPTIRSYQTVYSHFEEVTLTAGEDTEFDVAVTSGYVVMLYDFFASIPKSHLLGLTVKAIQGAVEGFVIQKTGYGNIVEHIPKGFPFFETIRFILHNYGDEDVIALVSCVGIQTDEEHYYLTVG
ncbi:MAG: hypothetical protein ABIH46_10465 [Chloroflexota bacterium]